MMIINNNSSFTVIFISSSFTVIFINNSSFTVVIISNSDVVVVVVAQMVFTCGNCWFCALGDLYEEVSIYA